MHNEKVVTKKNFSCCWCWLCWVLEFLEDFSRVSKKRKNTILQFYNDSFICDLSFHNNICVCLCRFRESIRTTWFDVWMSLHCSGMYLWSLVFSFTYKRRFARQFVYDFKRSVVDDKELWDKVNLTQVWAATPHESKNETTCFHGKKECDFETYVFCHSQSF